MKTLSLVVVLTGGVLLAAPPYGLVTVPASGAAWVDPEPKAQGDDLQSLKKDMAELKALMKEIRDLIKDDDPKGEAKGETAKEGANAFTAAVSACVQCHGSDVAAKKGEKFVMFQVGKGEDGKPQAVLRDDFEKRDLRKMISEVEDGTMPKKSSGKKLDAEQKAAFLAEMKARLEQK